MARNKSESQQTSRNRCDDKQQRSGDVWPSGEPPTSNLQARKYATPQLQSLGVTQMVDAVGIDNEFVDVELEMHDNVDVGVTQMVDAEVIEQVDVGESSKLDKGKGLMVEEDEYNSDEDSDFDVSEDSCEELIDDIIFYENVSIGEYGDDKQVANESESSDTSYSTEQSEVESGDEGSDDEVEEGSSKQGPAKATLQLGSIFSTKHQFKDLVTEYSVQCGRPTKFVKNDTRRVYAKCKKKDEGCDWHVHALHVTGELSFQIREIDLTHKCARQFNVDNVKSGWLARKFEKDFRCDPKRSVKGFRTSAIQELRCNISHQQAIRARQKALRRIEGSANDQYSKLWDYAEILRAKNYGSTVILHLDDSAEGKQFKRFYVCLQAVKRGFKAGCRPWIGVDGTHLSGLNRGVLLTAVTMDPNNDPYLLAYAVVPVENRDAWEWFLELLKDDLLENRHDFYTFMSDKQKGLLAAFDSVLPGVDNRFCVRHLHGNMKRAGFKGDLLKDLLWDAARACTVPAFNLVMEQIKGVDVKCFEWLQSKPPREWSRSHFTTIGKCDTLVNNMCEQINNCILDARDKPILTMLEWIRQYLMGKLQRYRDKADRKWGDKKICPRIEKLLEANQKHTGDCIPIKSNEFLYEVSSIRDGSRYAVDLQKMTCDCRKWELSGIPCQHAISAISAEGSDPTDFVSSCYSVDTYKDVYVHAITPMADAELWEKTGLIPPLPPAILKKKKCGRPPRQRKFSANESPSKKTKKSGCHKMPRQIIPKNKKAKKQQIEEVTTKNPREESTKDDGITDLTLPENDVINDLTPPENDGITDLTLPDVIENMTQHEDLQETQPEESVQEIPLRPTTAKGRKVLARRRAAAAAAERSTFKPPEQFTPGKKRALAALGKLLWPSNVQQSRQSSSLQIREPPPMSFHPGRVVGGSSLGQTAAEKEKDVGGLKVFSAGGKKFTNLSSLNAASREKSGSKS